MSGQVRATSSAKMVPLLMEVPWQPVIVFPLDLLPDLLHSSPTVFGGFASNGDLGGFGKCGKRGR